MLKTPDSTLYRKKTTEIGMRIVTVMRGTPKGIARHLRVWLRDKICVVVSG